MRIKEIQLGLVYLDVMNQISAEEMRKQHELSIQLYAWKVDETCVIETEELREREELIIKQTDVSVTKKADLPV